LTIWVVRHGQTDANADRLLLGRTDIDLNDVGRAQAQRLANVLPAGARIISSPLLRCRSTAIAIAKQGGGAPETAVGRLEAGAYEVDHRLVELDFGEYDMHDVGSVPPEVWQQWASDVHFAPPEGESVAGLFSRVSEVLDEMRVKAIESDVVLVTHMFPIKAALTWALGVGAEASWRSFVSVASITTIDVSLRGPVLRSFNIDTHLE